MSKILAQVGTLTVTEDEVNEFIAGMGPNGQRYDNPEGRRVVLNQLVNNKLLILDAKRNLLEAEPAFKAQLAKLRDNLLASYAMEKAISGVSVSDKDIEKYYEDNKEQFKTPEGVNASHILVKTEEEALDILGKIKSGEVSFEDAAREHSSCPSGESGGNLGDFTRGQMVPEFDAAVFAMEVGEITDAPVKTQFGYHLIKLNSKNEGGITPLADIKADLSAALLNEKRRAAYESKINQLKIMYPTDILG